MNLHQKCPHCGAKMDSYRHAMSKNLAEGLRKLYIAGGEGHAQTIGMSKSEFTNFQKLQYWNLIEKTGRAGVWRITERGKAFVHGEKGVPHYAITYRGRVLKYDGELINFSDCADFLTRTREDYYNEAQGVDIADNG